MIAVVVKVWKQDNYCKLALLHHGARAVKLDEFLSSLLSVTTASPGAMRMGSEPVDMTLATL